MTLTSGFFSNKTHALQGNKQREEYSFIHVGNDQFHAPAVALIDALQNSTRGNDAALKKILERFYQYYPKYISNQPYLTLSERMGILLKNTRKSEIVECMSYVLRQLAVDELYADPLKYRGAFKEFAAETSKDYLRDPSVKLPTVALNALAHSLGINITLSFKEQDKELRKKEVYVGGESSISAKLDLLIQVQGGCYFPGVKHPEDFAYVGQLAISAPKPMVSPNEANATLADILEAIEQDNKRLLQSYEQWRKNILSAVVAGELSRDQLTNLFISYYPVSSVTDFVSLPSMESERKQVIAGFPVEQEQKTIELLAGALAGWISTKQIEPDILDQVELQPSSSFR